MFNVKKIIASAKAILPKRLKKLPETLSKGQRIIVVYSEDSAVSIVAAGCMKEHLNGHDKSEFATFIEASEFMVREPVADVYIWVDLPKMNVVEDPSVQKAYDKARHIVLQGAGTGIWTTDDRLPYVRALNELLATGYTSTLVSDHTKINRDAMKNSKFKHEGREYDSRLYVGIVLNAIMVLEMLLPCNLNISRTAIQSDVVFMSEIQGNILPFNKDTTPLYEVLSIYDYVSRMSLYLQDALEIWPQIDDVAAEGRGLPQLIAENNPVALRYQRDLTRMRASVFKHGILQHVYTKVEGQKRTVSLLTTRVQKNFWLARRLIALAGKDFHNTRMTVVGHHVTTNARGELQSIFTASHSTRA